MKLDAQYPYARLARRHPIPWRADRSQVSGLVEVRDANRKIVVMTSDPDLADLIVLIPDMIDPDMNRPVWTAPIAPRHEPDDEDAP